MRYIWSAIGLLVSGIALYYFVAFLPSDLLKQIDAHRSVFLVGSLVLVPAYIVRAYKSWLLLNEPAKSSGAIAGSLYASIALNNALPFRLGDLLRLFYLRTVLRIGLAKATAALLIERVVDLFVILSLFVISSGVILGAEVYAFLSTIFGNVRPIYIVGLTMAALVLIAFLFSVRRPVYRYIWPILVEIDPNWPRAGKLLTAALLQWVLEIIALSTVSAALLPNVPQGQAVLSAFMSNLSTLIPSAPGYVGTFEVAGILPFKLIGGSISEIQALYVVLYHLVIWVFSTSLGLVAGLWLLFKRRQRQPGLQMTERA
jgi:uncharacterized membrane protein YbhN (UPF0104 family)